MSEPDGTSKLFSPWPPFLDWLDNNPDKAWEELYVFTWRLARLREPAVFRGLSKEDREDVFEEVLQGLQKDNFRHLRSYKSQGQPFAVWFWSVLRNRAIDLVKYNRRREHEDLAGLVSREDLGVSPDVQAELAELMAQVEAALEHLSPKCRLLLKAAAEEYTPKELQILLGLGIGNNKKVSDDLRHCRRKLVDELGQAGVTVELDS